MSDRSKSGCIAIFMLTGACAPSAPLEDGGDGSTQDPDGTDSAVPSYLCIPDETRCLDADTIGTCAPTGKEWLETPCGEHEACQDCAPDDDDCDGATCTGPCDLVDEQPSSAGCSFYAIQAPFLEVDDAIIIGNPSESETATVQLFHVPSGLNVEEPLGSPITIEPGGSDFLTIDSEVIPTYSSMYRTGGIHHVVSNLPIVSYLHTPWKANHGNDSAMLLPEGAMGTDYVVVSYPPKETSEPSYFLVIAFEDDTVVSWTPRTDAAGNGLPLPAVPAGETGTQTLNRFDTMRIAAASVTQDVQELRDLSGTLVHSTKPVWVAGGSRCATVPSGNPQFTCDVLLEQLIPLRQWGQRYVAPHSPVRDSELHYWRVFTAADDATITTTPELPGSPFVLEDAGSFLPLELPTGTSVVFESDKAIMPVQYLASGDAGAGEQGDPSMYQMTPVEQFLRRYAFVTGIGFDEDYVQIIRSTGSAPVLVDGLPVDQDSYEVVGNYEIADHLVTEGPHLAESEDPFGIIQVGYQFTDDGSGSTMGSYAHPGGMRTEEIYIP